MKPHLLMIVAVGLLIAADGPQEDDEGDPAKIQGSWKVVAAEDSGEKAPKEALKDLKWVITKDKITYKFAEKTTEWSYKLDPTTTPKWIDLTEGERTTLGIYELDGDNLKICFPEGPNGERERSTAFESKPNSVNDVLITLKREKS
jgi:uncharacterized protein (TIGR03067 family)